MEQRDNIVESHTAEQVEKWIPFARPIVESAGPPLPPPPPGHEFLLLSQTRGDVAKDILLFIFLFLAIALSGELLIGTIYRGVLASQYRDDEELSFAVARMALFPAIAWRSVTATILAIAMTRRRGLSLRSVGLTFQKFWLNLLLGLAAFVAILLGVLVLSILIGKLFPNLNHEFEKNADLIMKAVPRVTPAIFFGMSLVIGYYEELVFRGFLMPRLRRATNSWILAILLTTLVFGVLHLKDQAAAALLAIVSLSLIFSTVTIWRRSLVPAILAHALFDFSMFLQLYNAAGNKWK